MVSAHESLRKRESKMGNVRERSSIGAMDERSRKVQNVSTRTACPPKERDGCVARDELGCQFNEALKCNGCDLEGEHSHRQLHYY